MTEMNEFAYSLCVCARVGSAIGEFAHLGHFVHHGGTVAHASESAPWETGVNSVTNDLIRHVDLKLSRAEEQAAKLRGTVAAWCADNPAITRCELREGRLGYRLILERFDRAALTDDWGLSLGECVHNLRSALDNLAFALARLHCDPPPRPHQISFPIFQDEGAFNSGARLDQLLPAAELAIREIQPFQRGRQGEGDGRPSGDPLLLLQWLSNTDKHRVPSVALVAPDKIQFQGVVEFYSDEDASASVPPDTTVWAGPLAPGIILLEYKTKHPIAKVAGKFEVHASVAVETSTGLAPLEPTVDNLSQYTRRVVDRFRGFFG